MVQVNCCRVQEALRVLEEYGKLYGAEIANGAKQMRYQLYTLESKLLWHDLRQRLAKARAYLVTSPSERLLATVEAALKGGIDIVQYREKSADDEVRLELASKLKALCHTYNALLLSMIGLTLQRQSAQTECIWDSRTYQCQRLAVF